MAVPFELVFTGGKDERLFRAEASILRSRAHFRTEFFARERQIALNSTFSQG